MEPVLGKKFAAFKKAYRILFIDGRWRLFMWWVGVENSSCILGDDGRFYQL